MAQPTMGFRVLRNTGDPASVQTNEYELPASYGTAVFLGDLVKLNGTSNAVDGTPQINQAAAGDVPIGVVVGFRPVLTNLSLVYHLASTLQKALVADHPGLICAIQSSGTLAAGDIGSTANITAATAGSTVTGLSGMKLDETDVGTSTHTLLIERLLPDPSNLFAAGALCEVSFNTHARKSTPGV